VSSKIIPRNDTARRAYHTLNHLNLKYAPVGGKEGFIDGLVLREELQKAIKHGMGAHKVSEFITEKVSFDSVSEQPFVEDRFPAHTVKPVFKDAINKFNNNFSDTGKSKEIIKIASETASEMGVEAYCVGGMVRDMLLDIRHTDIDIIVKKDAVKFSRKLAKTLNGSYYVHDKFKTAVVNIPGREIDIATLRKEYYEVPAALPEVRSGTLKQDLARRDFSINAMAVQISPKKEYGQLIDYFGGIEDIKKKIIRILYPLSFTEDPTRIFRAARFEKRFDFKMTRVTLRQLKKTVNMNIEEVLTPDRIKEEIFKILSEYKAAEIIRRLAELGGLKCINQNMKVSNKALSIIKTFDRRAASFNGELKSKVKLQKTNILLLAFISDLGRKEGVRMLKIFNFSNHIKEAFKDLKHYEFRCRAVLSCELSGARIFKAINKISPLTVYYILITSDDAMVKKNIRRYLDDIKDIKPAVSGSDLIDMGYKPSREFSRMLYILKIARINKIVDSPETEKKFITDHFRDNVL
jgi:tRNA nucleotidyltransferase (CCA-adding enzyme)